MKDDTNRINKLITTVLEEECKNESDEVNDLIAQALRYELFNSGQKKVTTATNQAYDRILERVYSRKE